MTGRDLWLRLRALLRPRRTERDLHDELAFHVDREVEQLVAAGMSRSDARARARARFGSVALTADRCRDQRGIGAVDTVIRDVVYAGRMFRRAPLVAATIVVTVGLGLGLVTALFTLFNVFAFRTDAVPAVHEMMEIERVATGDAPAVRLGRREYDALVRDTSVFTGLGSMIQDINSRIDGRMMEGALVTGNFFQILGVRAAIGRALSPADDDRTVGRVVVLSHAAWKRLYDAEDSIVGRMIPVSGVEFAVVGVMPEGF